MIILTDIDDTLMTTRRKLKQVAETLEVGALSKDGDPISYIDPNRQQLISAIFNPNNTVIPVTARSIAGLDRVNLPFNSFAISNFGATITNPDKSLDDAWFSHVKKCAEASDILGTFNALIAEVSELSVVCSIKEEFDTPLYLNIRSPDLNAQSLSSASDLAKNLLNQANILNYFNFYQTDKDFAIIPAYFSKKSAAENVLSKLNANDTILGLGDNLLDLEFISLCHFAITPTDSSMFANLKGLL